VIQHGQGGVNVEKQKYDEGMGPAQANSNQDGTPGAHDSNDVLDRVFVAGIEVAACRKMLPMVVFVDQGIQKRHVQNVVTGCVANVQYYKHDKEGTDRVEETNIPDIERYIRRMPNVVAQSLDQDPFVNRVDAQKDNGLEVEPDVSDRFSRGSCRQIFLTEYRIHGVNN